MDGWVQVVGVYRMLRGSHGLASAKVCQMLWDAGKAKLEEICGHGEETTSKVLERVVDR